MSGIESRLKLCALTLLLLSAFAITPAARAFDRHGLDEINSNVTALTETLNTKDIDASLAAAGRLLHPDETPLNTGDGQQTPGAVASSEAERLPVTLSRALLGPILLDLALETGSQGHRELLEASSPWGGEVLVLQSGTATLETVSGALVERGWQDLLSGSNGRFTLRIPLVIAENAMLSIMPDDDLEMATELGAFIINTGELTIADASVAGSSANPRVGDFHPFILTARGGHAAIAGSRFSNLGFDSRPLMSGVSFGASMFASDKSTGIVRDSVFDNVRSVEVTGIDDFTFERNLIDGARGIGLRLERLKNGIIRDNVIVLSGLHGLLAIASTDMDVSGNIVAQSGARGFLGRDGVGHLTIRDNIFLANADQGIWIAGGACIDIRGNGILRNRKDGILVEQSMGTRIAGNLLVRNQGRAFP
nr:right-handed parallel beta-helix repeat-containing protein [Marinicella sp. W31]MDC2878134.1 right-handed parallel beta-helix repeat-containing protein [Marinicella sp. W31]